MWRYFNEGLVEDDTRSYLEGERVKEKQGKGKAKKG